MAQTYVIRDGVRRAKALLVAGHATASVECYVAGVRQALEVPLADLLSPKSEIDASRNAVERRRWLSLLQLARGTTTYPFPMPIKVTPGNRGTRLKDVDVL